jgi:3-keto-disaccharide hydrolase
MRHNFSLAVFLLLVGVGCNENTPATDKGIVPVEMPPQSEADGDFVFVPPALTSDEIREGWVSLFDGATLFGWDVPQNANWHVEDACIVADSGEVSLLRTPFQFDDFELRCDFHMAEGGNSGIFLRTAPTSSNPAKDTYELNICDDHPSGFNTGSLVTRHTAKGIDPVGGDWHSFRIRCEENRLLVWLDEKQIVDFSDTSDAVRVSGQIGLQMNSGRIAFRNIFLRPLHGTELFNGQDLTGWKTVPGSKSEFTVADSAIHVSNGPGFLETESTFGDFLLHIEPRTNGEALNSGVFFRAMQGTSEAPSNGYEMQIQNGYENDDRTKPADSGSGAIFRRAAARYVVANDREWFTETLIAQGDRIATWVNGYQVVNWQDTRELNDNPRKGRRTKAGHISLQGHDPTTNLDFRVVRIHQMPVSE